MISFSSAWAITLRHLRLWKHDPNSLLSIIYWPLLDILIWGFVGSWMQQSIPSDSHNYETMTLLGVSLWQYVSRGGNIVIFSFTEELWSGNLLNLFSLPLRIRDWIAGTIICTAIMMAIVSVISIIACIGLYQVNIALLLSTFTIFSLPLFICGLWISFVSLQLIVLFGKRSTELGFIIAWSLLPFSGAYYPIEVLPLWAQKLSAIIPMSHLFQGMRALVMHQESPWPFLIKGTALAILYTSCSIGLFVYCFKLSKKRGLARLMD